MVDDEIGIYLNLSVVRRADESQELVLSAEPSSHGPFLLEFAKRDDVLGIKGDDKVSTVALKRHQPSRTLYVGGHPNLKRFVEAIGVLVGDRDDWPLPRRP